MKASVVEMEGLLRGKCVPAKMLVNESLAEYLVRQFDALHGRAEAAERERDELRSSLIAASNMQSIHRDACQKAEAELARRDAAAGEPVEYQFRYHNHGTGTGEWCRIANSVRYEELLKEHSGDSDFSFRKLYTAAQPQQVVELKPDWVVRKGKEPCAQAFCNGYAQRAYEDKQALDAAGVKWEVKK